MKTMNRAAKQGFTLIEMLIVIIILGILAIIIIPQISASSDDAKLSALRADLTSMRSAVEIYYAQHNSAYPGDALPGTKPADVTSQALAFTAQLTRYTDANGNISNTKSATYKYGPYLKSVAANPFNSLNTVLIDSTTVDITARTADSSTGWKFYSKTGVLIANDGAHTAD